MDFKLNEEQLEWQKRSKHFAEHEIAPVLEALESDQNLKLSLYKKMAIAGFFTMTLSDEFLGSKTSSLAYLLALKEISKVDAGVGVSMAVTSMVAETIAKFASLELSRAILPKVHSGENVPLSFALTEEKVGSDARKIATNAVLHQNNYILNGEKWFITNADLSPYTIVLANLNGEGPTAFVVPKETPGFELIYKERKLGLLVANLVRIQLHQVSVSADYILGKPGDGFKIMMNSLNSGRLGIAAQAIGIAEAAYEASLAYSQERLQFEVPLNHHQEIAFKLADMKVSLDAAHLLLYKASWLKDQQKSYHLEAAEVKLYASEMCLKVVDQAVQIFGARGYVKDYPLERYYRDAKATTLYEGTSEIQRIVIAKEILKQKKEN